MKTVVGLFDDRDDAERAVRALMDNNVDRNKISVVTSDPEGKYQDIKVDDHGNIAGEGAATGAGSGAVAGGIIGLLIGIGAATVPIAGFLVAGPLAGLLIGAGAGAVTGGILGALIGLGIPEEHAETYAEAVRRGSVLVAVQCEDSMVDRVEDILDDHGAVDFEERAAYLRESGFKKYDATAPVYSATEVHQERERMPRRETRPLVGTAGRSGDEFDTYFREDWERNYRSSGPYEQYAPAYSYGRQASEDGRFEGRDWSAAENDLRTEWERKNPNTWEQYRPAVEAGYHCRQRVSSNRAKMM